VAVGYRMSVLNLKKCEKQRKPFMNRMKFYEIKIAVGLLALVMMLLTILWPVWIPLLFPSPVVDREQELRPQSEWHSEEDFTD
jgi:hypothetical protein